MNSSNLNCSGSHDLKCGGTRCNSDPSSYVWVGIYVVVIILGLVTNVILLRVLLKGKRSSSQVLGLNASVLNIIFIFSMPIEIYGKLRDVGDGNPADVFTSMNIFACPFLLASMCVERYIAVTHPIFYLRMNRLDYRVVWSVLVWLLTFVTAGLFIHFRFTLMLKAFSIVSCVFFAIMLACLFGIIWALVQRSPAQSSVEMNPMKRRALVNVLVVLVPAVITYTPAMAGLLVGLSINVLPCAMTLSMIGVFKFGVFIAPMFYVSHTKHILLCERGQVENAGDHKDTEGL